MARITIRVEDEIYDRLIVRAMRTGRSLTALVRPAVTRAADPLGDRGPDPDDTRVALLACLVSLLLLDIENRSPDILEKGVFKARALLRRWGMSEEVCDLAVAEMEARHAR